MTPSELAELFDANPTAAFRLTLSSGGTVDVVQPGRTLIESSTMYVGQYDRANARVANGTRIVSIPNIAMVEQIDPRRPARPAGGRNMNRALRCVTLDGMTRITGTGARF